MTHANPQWAGQLVKAKRDNKPAPRAIAYLWVTDAGEPRVLCSALVAKELSRESLAEAARRDLIARDLDVPEAVLSVTSQRIEICSTPSDLPTIIADAVVETRYGAFATVAFSIALDVPTYGSALRYSGPHWKPVLERVPTGSIGFFRPDERTTGPAGLIFPCSGPSSSDDLSKPASSTESPVFFEPCQFLRARRNSRA